jgi:hypothetical protein
VLGASFSQWLLVHVPPWLLFSSVVLGTTGLSLIGVLLVRRYAPHFAEGVNNTVGGILMAILGTMYAVVLGFVVVTLWTTLDRAEETTRQEAGALLDVYRDNTTLSFQVASQTQQAVRDYARIAAEEEWPELAVGRTSRRADRAALRVFEVFRDFEPRTNQQSTMLSSANSRYDDFLAARRTRLSLASAGLPGVFWISLLLGAVVTLGFSAFLGQPSLRSHLAMTGALGLMVGLMLAVVLLLNDPFSGNLSVQPGPLQALLSAG